MSTFVFAALVAALAFAAGGNALDDDGGTVVAAVEHVQLARRMVEVNLGIREAWRSFLADCDPTKARIVLPAATDRRSTWLILPFPSGAGRRG